MVDEYVNGLPDFLPRRVAINVMELIKIDMVGLQTPQTVLAGLANMVGRQAAAVRARNHGLIELRCQHHFIALASLSEPLAHDLFRDAVSERNVRPLRTAVDVSRIDEIDAQVGSSIHDFKGGFLVRTVSEIHRAQA